jgi:hypothetical protein
MNLNLLLATHFLNSSANSSSAAKGRRNNHSFKFKGAVPNMRCSGGMYTISNMRIISIAIPARRYLFVKTPALNNGMLSYSYFSRSFNLRAERPEYRISKGIGFRACPHPGAGKVVLEYLLYRARAG